MAASLASAANNAALVLATILLPSCEEPPASEDTFEPLPIGYVTDEVEIATSFYRRLCPANLQRIDTHVRRLHDVLGTDRRRTLYIHEYDMSPLPGCPAGSFGCFRPDHDVAIALPYSMSHELVHAASIDLGLPAPFWNEGLAEALSDRAIAYEPAELVSLVGAHPRDYGYSIPGHFVRWLIGWGGSEAFVEFFVIDDFEAVYGMALAEVEGIYDAEAPEVLPAPFACEDEPLLAEPDGSFEWEVELDCENSSSMRFPPVSAALFVGESRLIEVVTPTTFSVLVEGGEFDHVLIGGCQSAAGGRVDELGDVPNETVSTYFDRQVSYFVGEEHDVFLPAWKYRLWLVTHHEPLSMRLTMRPK